jgi:hypothetical protein
MDNPLVAIVSLFLLFFGFVILSDYWPWSLLAILFLYPIVEELCKLPNAIRRRREWKSLRDRVVRVMHDVIHGLTVELQVRFPLIECEDIIDKWKGNELPKADYPAELRSVHTANVPAERNAEAYKICLIVSSLLTGYATELTARYAGLSSQNLDPTALKVNSLGFLEAEGLTKQYSDTVSKFPSDWHRRRKLVLKRDDGKCRKCGIVVSLSDSHTHHVRPRALGGDHALDNLITLCVACHRFVHSSPDYTGEFKVIIDRWFIDEAYSIALDLI